MSLFKSIAVEPEVFADKFLHGKFSDAFGVQNGRLIPEFPRKWRRLVCEAISLQEQGGFLGPVKAKQMREFVCQQLKRSALVRSGANFDLNRDWLDNARRHLECYVLTSKTPIDEDDRVLEAGELDRSDSRFEIRTQCEVLRTGKELTKAVGELLIFTQELQIVDRYFDPRVNRWRRPIAEFLRLKKENRSRLRLFRIHTETRDSEIGLGRLKDEYRRFLSPILNEWCEDAKVVFRSNRDRSERIHARFLLTEMGGVQFDHGFDEGNSPDERCVLSLMDDRLWADVRHKVADYQDGNTSKNEESMTLNLLD